MQRRERSRWMKQRAKELGFLSCGIAQAQFLEDEAPRLEQWLNQHRHGEMGYMANHFDKRLDPRKLVEGAKSVISFTYNYYPEKELELPFKISKYAYGRDYHKVLKKKLLQLLNELKTLEGDFHGRAFVDSAPIMDKAWAAKSGLGWLGKNSNLITKKTGSFYFICELVLDLDFEYDLPTTDHCGSCTACIDACPTNAIYEPYKVDGSKCISYYTIELKDQLPPEAKGKMENWAFGCDICQDVCPWNKHARPHSEPDFTPHEQLETLPLNDWLEITQDVFDELFKGSPIKRTQLDGFKRNLNFLFKK